jgi:hypothetical protein
MAEGYFDFVAGVGLSAANLEDYCERQSAMRFASAAARDAALATIKTEGMLAYLKDVHSLTQYNSTGTWDVVWVSTAWIAPTLINSWTNTGSGLTTAGYRKVGDAVFIKGSVGGGANGNSAFLLPVGFRPVEQWEFANSINIAAAGVFHVKIDGNVVPSAGGTARVALNCCFSLV